MRFGRWRMFIKGLTRLTQVLNFTDQFHFMITALPSGGNGVTAVDILNEDD
jgi:hypothetical protein